VIDTAALREKVLDLAIRGKLVPQDPNDEPASVLLERIHEQKLQMVREGKLKAKDVKDDTIIFKGDDNCYYEKFSDGSVKNIQDKIPFDLPECWSWARGKNCFQEMKTRKPNGEEFVYIDIDAIDNKKNTITNAKVLKVKDAPSRACRYVECGSVLFSLVRPYLKNIAFVEEKYASSIASSGFFVCTSTGVLYPRYSFYLMISPYVVNGINQFMKGDNSPSVSKSDIENWLYPIPPYNEQKQIVDCLNKTLAIIQNIHDTENELQGEITSIKSKILELAIQGKLVPQDENDEPASVLLERIRAERKAKLGKKYVESYIFKGDDNCYYEKIGNISKKISEEMPFGLPFGWCWITLKEIATITSGKTPKNEQITDFGNIPYFKVGDMNLPGNEIFMEVVQYYVNDCYTDITFPKNSFIFPKNGGALLTNKKRILKQESLVDLNTGVLIPSSAVNNEFMFYLFSTVDFTKNYKGSTIPTIDNEMIGNIVFALPPIEEQSRIVQKIKAIMDILKGGD